MVSLTGPNITNANNKTTNRAMKAERALRSIRGGDVRKEEEEERRESEGSGRHRRGGAKLALLPPIFELKIILEEP